MLSFIYILIAFLFAGLAWRDLKFALVVLMGLLPTYLLRFSVNGIPFTLLEAMILAAFAVWLSSRIPPLTKGGLGGGASALVTHPLARPLLLLLAAACFGVVIASDTFGALGIWKAYFIEPALVFVMLVTTFTSSADWRAAAKALGVSAIIVSAFAIFQVVTSSGIPIPWDAELRATSIFPYPNSLGLFLAPIAAFGTMMSLRGGLSSSKTDARPPLVRAIFARPNRERLFWIAVATLSFLGCILSQTEAALGAIPLAIVITAVVGARRAVPLRAWATHPHCRVHVALIALFLFTSVALIAFVPSIRQKILFQDYSGQVRLSQWSETSTLLKQNPIFGVGLNEYPTALAPFHDGTLYEIFQYPHNIFLNIWVELGLLGLIAFLWLAWEVIKISNPKRLTTNYHLPVLAALLTMTIHGLVDVPYFKNDLAVMTWFFLAFFAHSARIDAIRDTQGDV